MIAVCNTSPVSNLIQIAALPLLLTQFSEVCIPPEVAAELDEGADILDDWRAAPGATGLETRPATDRALLRELSATLHAGEAAPIALAAEIGDHRCGPGHR